MKVFAVVAVWGNTKGNHAGMFYLANKLQERFAGKFVIIPTPTKGSRFFFHLYKLYNSLLGIYLRFLVKRDDVVFLMEYLLPETEQSVIYKLLNKKCEVRAIAHLVLGKISSFYSDEKIIELTSKLSKLYVLGTSLKDYFCKKGIPETKVISTFHYVDNSYYKPLERESKRLTCICMGNMDRDYDSLNYFIEQNPDMDFIVCKGKTKKFIPLVEAPNLKIFGYVAEDELLSLMQTSDISLNLMKDTIGSNVITTSLACGLVVLASNVGSIRNYIEHNKEGFLFDNNEECNSYLNNLNKDRLLLKSLKKNAIKRANDFSLNKFCDWFNCEFYGK